MAKLVLNLSANEIQDKLIKEILSKYLKGFLHIIYHAWKVQQNKDKRVMFSRNMSVNIKVEFDDLYYLEIKF